MADPADPAPDDLAPDDLAEAILGEPRYTVGELMASTGTDRALADELWLSLGFPLTRDEETASFTEADAEALRSLGTLLELGFIDRDQLMAMTRVMGQTLSRLASTQVQLFHDELAALVAPAPGDADPLDAEVRAATTELLVPGVERFVSYCWRRHLFAALDRDLHAGSGRVIGFVDLVEFTRTTRDLGPDELATLVGRFERYVYDEVTGSGAHLRKLLGDGVMFDAPDVATAAGAALALVLRCAEDPHLRGARGGLAAGPTLAVEGDVYGETVNRASRLADLARPNTVLADGTVAGLLQGRPGFSLRSIGRQPVKGLGRIDVVVVRPALS
ncbi:MAG: hypothetical protein KDB35_06965 [Acidimicrobiales bacterium]|nr:hypothetical protein [Acidimicrobiales bacterium]MCB1251540.1 hypothetical protein [Acidimicrobiales bacterium]MCB1260135.1 hypothetical protein [Acidimicrobiales bacterium]